MAEILSGFGSIGICLVTEPGKAVLRGVVREKEPDRLVGWYWQKEDPIGPMLSEGCWLTAAGHSGDYSWPAAVIFAMSDGRIAWLAADRSQALR
jgi:hypothetical protein